MCDPHVPSCHILQSLTKTSSSWLFLKSAPKPGWIQQEPRQHVKVEGRSELATKTWSVLGWVVCMSSSILIIWLKRFTHQQCWRLWSLKVLLVGPNVEGGHSSDPGRDTGGWKGANAGEHVIIRIYMILISYPLIFMTERTDLIKMYYYTYMKSFGAKNQWFDDTQIEMFLRVSEVLVIRQWINLSPRWLKMYYSP